MRRVGNLAPSNSWTVAFGFSMPVDFCVWLLERDGLRVPPFDRHPDGTGELRAMGIDAEGWNTWFRAVAQSPWPHALPHDLYPGPSPSRERHPGVEPLRRRLRELWDAYGPVSNQRRIIEPSPRSPHWERYHRPNLYQALRPYHGRIPAPFVVHLARYGAPVEAPIPPSRVVLGLDELPKPDAFRGAIIQAAEALIGRP